jgi:hypothetical protein
MEERKRKNDPILDKCPELTDKDFQVIQLFIEGMSRRDSYRNVYDQKLSDASIYNWWKLPKVVRQLQEYEMQLDNYNVVCDKTLLNIIKSDDASNRDKISAIKHWSELRDRVKTKVVIEQEKTIKFDNVTDENLELIINAIKDGNK